MGEAKQKSKYGSAEFTPDRVGKSGALAFLSAFKEAPPGADIEMRIAHDESGTLFVVCSIGAFKAALGPYECRVLASAAESALRAYPDEKDAKVLPDLIISLRAMADRADAGRAALEQEGGR